MCPHGSKTHAEGLQSDIWLFSLDNATLLNLKGLVKFLPAIADLSPSNQNFT